MTEERVIRSVARICGQLDDPELVRREIAMLNGSHAGLLGRFLSAGFDELEKDQVRAQVLAQQVIDRLLLSVMDESPVGEIKSSDRLVEQIRRSPGLVNRWERLQEEKVGSERDSTLNLMVIGENGWQQDTNIGLEPCVLSGIRPGHFQIRLQGRLLWAGRIEVHHLVFEAAQWPLRAAAATEAAAPEPTLQVSLLSNELVLSVYAGIETGSICVGCPGS